MQGQDGIRRHLRRWSGLVPGGSLPRPLAAALAALAVAVAAGWGCAALALHLHEVGAARGVPGPGPVGRLFADGSSPLTVWPGWAAALALGGAALRLRRSAVEPPPRRRGAPEPGTAELRAALRREYLRVRWVLLAVGELALADCCRLAASGAARLAGVRAAGDALGWMGAETAGLVAAATALAAWLLAFRVQLEAIGALPLDRPDAPPATERRGTAGGSRSPGG